MSKQTVKKFKKNDYSYDDNEEFDSTPRNWADKKKEKRVERALRTKDITALIDDDEDDEYWDRKVYR